MINIIDTFKDYEICFREKLDSPVEDKIDLWERCYISKYPELEKKCKDGYESKNYSWRRIAQEKVFNRTEKDFNKMTCAHRNILEAMKNINTRAEEVFNLDLDINLVLYCGLCNSAGWVDTYNGKRAVLYGIDKIAELNWHTIQKIESLISHELCHVVHFQIRGEDNLPGNVELNNYNKGIWSLYEEGFAQFFQYKLLGKEADSRGRAWIEECRINERQLKKLYLEALHDEGKGTRDFFGDWFKVLEISDVGYFLGAELVRKLYIQYNIAYIAQLPFIEIEKQVMNFLEN